MFSFLILCASLTVSDGDTLRCNNQLLHLLGSGVIDVHGIDTPELLTGKCEKERELARLARDRLEELIDGENVRIIAEGYDRDGRPLVNLYVNGREIGRQLLNEGFAMEWRKGGSIDWCR